MAVKIRLKRIGKIRTPFYRVVVADSRKKRDGRVIEEIGTYNPKTDPSTVNISSERAQYWLGVGAQPTEAVTALLKLTGDIGGNATLKTPEVKQSKEDRFNEALKDLHDAPKAGATTAKKSKADKSADETKSDETKSDEAGADEAKADETKSDEPKAEEVKAEEVKADEASADEAGTDA